MAAEIVKFDFCNNLLSAVHITPVIVLLFCQFEFANKENYYYSLYSQKCPRIGNMSVQRCVLLCYSGQRLRQVQRRRQVRRRRTALISASDHLLRLHVLSLECHSRRLYTRTLYIRRVGVNSAKCETSGERERET